MVSLEPMRSVGVVLLVLALLASCAHAGSTNEKHPVKADLGQYRTCTLNVDSDRMPTAEPDASAFEDYLAGRLKEGGVLQPLEMMESGTPDLTLRIRVTDAKETTDAADVKLVVMIVETRSGDELGELEVTGTAKTQTNEDKTRGARRNALHHAADEIVSYIASKRSSGGGREPPPPAPRVSNAPPRAEDPFRQETPGQKQKICASTCGTPSSSALSESEIQRVTTQVDGSLQALRSCLDRVGGDRVEPAVILRFGGGGDLVGMRIDMGGYEDLLCVDAVRTRPPRVRVAREAMVRCVFHCS
jgi:hypothetical protein